MLDLSGIAHSRISTIRIWAFPPEILLSCRSLYWFFAPQQVA